MRAVHARRSRLRFGIVAAILASFVAGCGSGGSSPGPTSSNDPKAGARRREMAEFQKKQEAASQK